MGCRMAVASLCIGWAAAAASLRSLCPNPRYQPSIERRYGWNSLDIEAKYKNRRFAIDGAKKDMRMLEIGGPTHWAMSFYTFVGPCDNVVQRNHFGAAHQDRHYEAASHEDGAPYAPLLDTFYDDALDAKASEVRGRTFQRHGAQLNGIDDGSYRVVFASHVLEHFLDPLAALREWDRVIEPGGNLLLVVPWAPAVKYDAHRPPATMQELLHLSAANASHDESLLTARAEALIDLWGDWEPRARASLFSLCDDGVEAGSADCRVDENLGHWAVWDLDLLREAVEGCLGYTVTALSFQEPHHQIIMGKKPFKAGQAPPVEVLTDAGSWANATVARAHADAKVYDVVADGALLTVPEYRLRLSGCIFDCPDAQPP